MNKNNFLLKGVISYILLLNVLAVVLLVSKGLWILETFNVFFITLFVINVFILIHNGVFSFKKNPTDKDSRLILLYNLAFTLISGLNIRMFGFIFNNNLGVDISAYFLKNYGGQTFGFEYDVFNLSMKFFFYDAVKYSGFGVQGLARPLGAL
ncbi:MAG: hypothetical protein ABIN13_08105 [Mucilaginibacter sp.]